MYVDLAGLARYKSDFNAWARGALLPKDAAAARVRTAKAGAVSFVPVQETPLDVSVDFLFAETPPASGDKGPDNPSTISGVSEVKVGRVGRNLLLKVTPTYSPNPSPVTITQNADGTYTLNGTNNTNNIIYVAITDSAYVFSGSKSSVVLNSAKSYTMSGTLISGSYTAGPTSSTYSFGYSSNNGYYSSANFPLSGKTSFTLASKPDADGKFIARMNISPGSTFANAVFAFQLEEGDTATDFEAPMLLADANHDIPLGNTYYGGTLDVASGVMTVTWVGIVYDGTENITKQSDLGDGTPQYALPVPSLRQAGEALQSGTHFPIGYTANCGYVRTSGGSGYRVYPVGYATLDSFTEWVASQYAAGTPVTVAYKTATPYIVQLTSTEILSLTQSSDYDPCVNTVYTNASAVQVGYLKHPSATSADLRNAVVSLGGGV